MSLARNNRSCKESVLWFENPWENIMENTSLEIPMLWWVMKVSAHTSHTKSTWSGCGVVTQIYHILTDTCHSTLRLRFYSQRNGIKRKNAMPKIVSKLSSKRIWQRIPFHKVSNTREVVSVYKE